MASELCSAGGGAAGSAPAEADTTRLKARPARMLAAVFTIDLLFSSSVDRNSSEGRHDAEVDDDAQDEGEEGPDPNREPAVLAHLLPPALLERDVVAGVVKGM